MPAHKCELHMGAIDAAIAAAGEQYRFGRVAVMATAL